MSHASIQVADRPFFPPDLHPRPYKRAQKNALKSAHKNTEFF